MKKDEDSKIEYVSEDADMPEKKIAKAKKNLKTCKQERQKYLEGWQRTQADFQNYIKQKDAEMQGFRKFATEDVMLAIIPIMDNLILACESIPEDIASDNWVKGVEQVRKHFKRVLNEKGVKKIIVSVGDKFDPAYHESTGETEFDGESGTIAEVLQGGYTLNDKVIRASMVKLVK